MVMADKLPPFDIKAEEACIAAILIDGTAIADVAKILQPHDFYREQHRWVYEGCLALWERDEHINEVTLAHELGRREKLDESGGLPFLARITTELPTAVGIEHYAQIVRRDSIYRQMITAGSQIVALAYEGGPDLDSALRRSEDLVLGLDGKRRTSDLLPLKHYLEEFWSTPGPFEVGSSPEAMGPVRSGFMDVDTLLGGFHAKDLVVIAARPSVGKSALLLNIARNAAAGSHACVAVFSLEMSGESLAQRLLASESGVDGSRIRLGNMNDLEQRRAYNASQELADLDIFIDNTSMTSVPQIQAKLRRLEQLHRKADLVVIDYLQLMTAGGKYRDNRVQEVSEISRGLKMLAVENEIPVIAAAQLSRAPEMRQPHIPMLSDLRESGSIEQDADVVMFIYREDIYVTKEEWEMRNFDQPYPEGITKLIIAKHRNGPTGVVHMRFRNNLSRFEDLMVLEEEIA
jgi:replicative DNA helicase